MLPDGSSSEATPPESSLSTDIIVLEALLEAERDGVAAMNEVIFLEAGNYEISGTDYASNPRIGGSKNVAFEDGGGPAVSAI